MKKILVFLLFVSSVAGFSQDLAPAKIPVPVMNTFNIKFPKALNTKWQRAGLFYDAKFVMGVADHQATIDSVGTMLRHEYDISSRSLPKPVLDNLIQNYGRFKVEDAQRIDVGRTSTTYRVQIKFDSEQYKVIFDQSGKELEKK
jgi:hypothetical protein